MEEDEQNTKKNQPASSSSSEKKKILIPTLLPEEIIIDILLRLPVESLLRCRSVCKAWRSLISDPKFVKSHLNLSVRSHDHARHRLIYSSFSNTSVKSCSLFKFQCDMSVDAVELDCPLKCADKPVWIVGSCNGLICVTNREGILYIWNPTTRRSHRLPHWGMKLRTNRNFMYSFGYLESNDDYKVVGTGTGPMPKHGGGFRTEVIVYSMKTENWKRIGEVPNGFCLLRPGKYLSGALHWAVSRDFRSWRIVSLDLAKETYDEVPQPVYGKNGFVLSLGVLGDRLTVMCKYDDGLQWDVWVMKEYGVKESWAKLVSIQYVADPARYEYSVPLYISNDGKLLLKRGKKLSLCDPKDKHIRDIQIMEAHVDGDIYVESLVAPVGQTR